MARSEPRISATFASRALSPSALAASAFSSWARSFIAARSSGVNPVDVDFCVPFFADFLSAICEAPPPDRSLLRAYRHRVPVFVRIRHAMPLARLVPRRAPRDEKGGWRHLPALLIAAALLVPLYFMFSGSLRQTGLPPPRTPELLPSPLAWSNYERAFELVDIPRYTLNSLIVVAF